MALVSKNFGDIITFTRASTATYFDSAGVLQSAAIDAPRFDYNPSTLAARGFLIEEARTNLLTYSEEFDNAIWATASSSVSADVVLSPNGTINADKLVEDATNSQHNINRGVTVTIGASYAFTVFAKAAERSFFRLQSFNATGDAENAIFDLSTGTVVSESGTSSSSISPVGNGWYRCSIIAINNTDTGSQLSIQLFLNGTTGTYTGDGTSGIYIWGAQFEAGAFPTSYIPTTTTALTRSADVASVNTLSPWYNQTQGSLYAEASLFGFGTTPAVTSFSDGTDTGNLIQTNTSGAGLVRYRVTIGGVAQVNNLSSGVTATANTTFKAATGYAASDFAISVNGTAAVTQASGNVPTPTQLRLLQTGSGGSVFSGHLRRITYYPRRLSDAELQSITA